MLDAIARAAESARAEVILVPDTSVLLKNPDLSAWSPGRRALIVFCNVVVGELDNRKKQMDKRPDEAKAAGIVLAALAALAQTHKLPLGGPLREDLWAATVPFQDSFIQPGLNPKAPDHQIASVAGAISLLVRGVPCLLLTNDNGQAVAAAGAGIDHFRSPHPFTPENRTDFDEVVSRVEIPALGRVDRLHNNIPRRELIVGEFVGRQRELNILRKWLRDDKVKWALTGAGGKGKTAIAYEFATEVAARTVSPEVQAVAWLSAKRRRFVEGRVEDIPSPDFRNLAEALDLLLDFFQEADVLVSLQAKRERALEHLTMHPTLLVVDDIDTISDVPEDLQADEGDVYEFFTDDVLKTKSRVLFTARNRLFGMAGRQTEVPGLQGEEAHRYIHAKAEDFGIRADRLETSLDRIVEATEGSPLYIEDLLKLCLVTGVGDAIHQWNHHRGDAARAYALQREIEELSHQYPSDANVLIACSECEGSASVAVLSQLLGRSEADVEDSLTHLRQFYLVPEATEIEGILQFDLTRNTRALVRDRYGKAPVAQKVRGALTALGLRPSERGEGAEIDRGCLQARLMAQVKQFRDAEHLLNELSEKYPNRPVILQVLGWLYKRWEPAPRVVDARGLFQRAHELDLDSEDLFRHWSELEEGEQQYRRAAEIGDMGVKAHPNSIGLILRAAQAHRRYAIELRRELDSASSTNELDRVLELVKTGADVKARDSMGQRLKSQLFECGAKAALQHPSKGPGKELLGLWKRELPNDKWLVEYSPQLSR